MRITLPFLILLACAGALALPAAAAAQADRGAIEQALRQLVQNHASDEEINRYLRERRTRVEEFCAVAPEHRDCLQTPALTFVNEETATLRLLADSLRMAPAAGGIHLALVCLRAGTGAVRVQPLWRGAALTPAVAEAVCPGPDFTVHLDLTLPGDYAYGRHTARTADQFAVDFPAP
jgi:hypothetical protein